MMKSHFVVISVSIIGATEGSLGRSYKSVTGRSAPYQRIVEKNVMKACIKALTANGYYINDFSPVRLQVLHEDNRDVTAISE